MNYEALMKRIESDKRRWTEAGEQALLDQMFDAYQGLKFLGWKDGQYAPRNEGIRYRVIQTGSTGTFMCSWQANPHVDGGLFMVEDGGESYPTSNKPTLWKPLKEHK